MPNTIDSIARVAHEANRAYCAVIGDFSQLPWDEAPEWQRQSSRNGVIFHLTHPDAPISASHESWRREKEMTGWSFGPVKDVDKREHPCMVDFYELPPEQQQKDYLFRGIVWSFVRHGYDG